VTVQLLALSALEYLHMHMTNRTNLLYGGGAAASSSVLAQLSRLQRLQAWYGHDTLPAEGPESLAHPLASGAWQRSVRSITADWSLLRRSGAAFLGALP
jgi:hypothetical protein